MTVKSTLGFLIFISNRPAPTLEFPNATEFSPYAVALPNATEVLPLAELPPIATVLKPFAADQPTAILDSLPEACPPPIATDEEP